MIKLVFCGFWNVCLVFIICIVVLISIGFLFFPATWVSLDGMSVRETYSNRYGLLIIETSKITLTYPFGNKALAFVFKKQQTQSFCHEVVGVDK